MQVDVDRLLRRRLYLQRYVTSLVNDVASINEPGDKQLVAMLSDFSLNADERTLAALSRQRTSNPQVREVISSMRTIAKDQRNAANDLLTEQMIELIDREAVVTTAALGQSKPPSMFGVATLPISGVVMSAIISNIYDRYYTRLLSDVSQAAARDPRSIVSIVRGTQPQRRRDGILHWRDERMLRPDIDYITNGTAANSSIHVYSAFDVEQIDFVATLDFRTCPTCYAAEQGSPYDIGTQPAVPQHPRCRCLHLPHLPDSPEPERPFVRDDRSVRNIPRSERAGRIGQTRDTIEQFFNRMTAAERRDYMGPSRAALWEAGKIDDIRDLVNQRTLRPLRLDELPEL